MVWRPNDRSRSSNRVMASSCDSQSNFCRSRQGSESVVRSRKAPNSPGNSIDVPLPLAGHARRLPAPSRSFANANRITGTAMRGCSGSTGAGCISASRCGRTTRNVDATHPFRHRFTPLAIRLRSVSSTKDRARWPSRRARRSVVCIGLRAGCSHARRER